MYCRYMYVPSSTMYIYVRTLLILHPFFLLPAWKFVKLMEVTISSDPKDAYADGHIKLVEKG